VRSWQGWYRNRVARVLVIFMLTNIGTMIGEWIGIVRIYGRLAG
jgi:pheromone shutdown protein TraB